MSLAVAQQAGDTGPGVSWISDGETVVGILGPDGTTVFAQFARQPDGSVQMQIVPRTGTLTELAGTVGGEGEMASMPAEGGVAVLNGLAEPIFLFGKRGGVRSINVAGTGAAAFPAGSLDSRYPRIRVTKDFGVNSITGFLAAITPGAVKGELFDLQNDTSIALTGTLPGTGSGPEAMQNIPAGYIATFVWTGTQWSTKSLVKSIYSGISLGVASQLEAVTGLALGFGGSIGASAAYSVAFHKGATTAEKAVAFQNGSSNHKIATAMQFARTRWAASLAGVPSAGGTAIESAAYAIEPHSFLMTALGSGTTPTAVTINGDTLGDSTTVKGSDFNGLLMLTVDIYGYDYSTTPYRWVRAKRVLSLLSDGSTMTLQGGLETVGADVVSGAGYGIAVTASVASNRLVLSCSSTSATSTDEWWAQVAAVAGVYRS